MSISTVYWHDIQNRLLNHFGYWRSIINPITGYRIHFHTGFLRLQCEGIVALHPTAGMKFLTSVGNAAHQRLFLSLYLIRFLGGFSFTWKNILRKDGRNMEYSIVKYLRSSFWKLWSYYLTIALFGYIIYVIILTYMTQSLDSRSSTLSLMLKIHNIFEFFLLAYLNIFGMRSNKKLHNILSKLNNCEIDQIDSRSVSVRYCHNCILVFVFSNMFMVLLFIISLFMKYDMWVIQETINMILYSLFKFSYVLFYMETLFTISKVYDTIVSNINIRRYQKNEVNHDKLRSIDLLQELRKAKASILQTYSVRTAIQEYIGQPIILMLTQTVITVLMGIFSITLGLDDSYFDAILYPTPILYGMIHLSFYFLLINLPSIILKPVIIKYFELHSYNTS